MKKPNVIFILADDMGYGDFSVYNGGLTETNALNSLVEDGMTLNNCYATSPVCAPSRASLMTGKYPQRTGVIDTLGTRGYDELKTKEITIADIFKKNGYKTGLVGKWHLGTIGDEFHPNNRGFDYFFGFRGGWTDYYQCNNVEKNGKKIDCCGEYLTDLLSKEAVKYIRDNKDAPFFLHLAYNAPHYPFQAPKELVDKYLNAGEYTKSVACIYAMIEVMDKGLKDVLSELKNQGLEEDTIIIFSSDNGPQFGGEGEDCIDRFNCDLRGHKNLIYEGGIKVPAVVKWKGKIKSASKSDEVVSHMDWLPTLMNMCNLKTQQDLDMDGMDVSCVFQEKEIGERKLFWQWNRYYPVLEGNAAMRKGDVKLVHPPIDKHLTLPRWEIAIVEDLVYNRHLYKTPIDAGEPALGTEDAKNSELFDLNEDCCETNNIINENMELADSMEKQLEEWFEKVEKDRLN